MKGFVRIPAGLFRNRFASDMTVNKDLVVAKGQIATFLVGDVAVGLASDVVDDAIDLVGNRALVRGIAFDKRKSFKFRKDLSTRVVAAPAMSKNARLVVEASDIEGRVFGKEDFGTFEFLASIGQLKSGIFECSGAVLFYVDLRLKGLDSNFDVELIGKFISNKFEVADLVLVGRNKDEVDGIGVNHYATNILQIHNFVNI